MGKNFLLATGLLAGTIIGAGVFALPYVFNKLGWGIGVFYLLAFGLVYSAIHRMYASLLEKHRGGHEFVYLAGRYLPRRIGGAASLLILGEMILVLVVYLALAPSFLGLIFPESEVLPLVLFFWAISSLFMFAKLSILGWAEAAGIFGILAIIFVIFFAGAASFLKLELAPQKIDWPCLRRKSQHNFLSNLPVHQKSDKPKQLLNLFCHLRLLRSCL